MSRPGSPESLFVHIFRINSRMEVDFCEFCNILGLENGGGVREAASPPVPARCGTTPIQPTGEVRPALASRAGNQAREPRRRETRARAGTGAQDTRESGSRYLGKPGGGKTGTEWNETGWRNDMQDADGYGFEEPGRTLELSPPACATACTHLVSVRNRRPDPSPSCPLPVIPGLVPLLSGLDLGDRALGLDSTGFRGVRRDRDSDRHPACRLSPSSCPD